MPQSLVLNWLNENEYRAYPLRLLRNREVLVTGLGRLSPGSYSSAAGGYLMNGVAGASFSSQVSPGDQIEINGTRMTVLKPNNGVPITDSTVYTSGTWFPPENYLYYIVKKNFSPDTGNTVDPNFDGLVLDANLVYNDTLEDSSLYGKLIKAYPSGNDLVFEVGGQTDFVVEDYLDGNTVYPVYVRNAEGSLLVVGQTAKSVVTPWLFTNCLFEPSVITRMDRAWRGVTGLSFNGSTPIDGYVEFLEGYQVGLTHTAATNALKISVGKALGKPIGCDRIFGEAAPDDCTSLVSYINGAFARTDFGEVNLQPGNHIAIYPDPDRHRIYVGLTFNETDICKTVPARPVSQI